MQYLGSVEYSWISQILSLGGCGSEVERSSSNQKIGGSVPGSFGLHVKVSLGKTLNPELLRLWCVNVYE